MTDMKQKIILPIFLVLLLGLMTVFVYAFPVTGKLAETNSIEIYVSGDSVIISSKVITPSIPSLISLNSTSNCGNNICEQGESPFCPGGLIGACSKGTCPGDCKEVGTKGFLIKVPSSFSLVKGQTVKVTNYQNMEVKLTGIFTNPECKTKPCPGAYFQEYVKVEISTPGGCGPNADPICLGSPGYSNEFTIRKGKSVEALGIKLALLQVSADQANFSIEFLSKKESSCGNNICEQGESPFCPSGGIIGACSKGTCPEDCQIELVTGCKQTGDTISCPILSGKPIKAKISTIGGVRAILIGKSSEGNISIKEGSSSVESSEKLVIEDKRLFIGSAEGNKEIKITPLTVSNIAIKQLKLKNYKIELKDVGNLVYEIVGKKNVKIMGFIKVEMKIKSQVNAESGFIEKTEKPWWSFLAKEE